MLPVIYSSSRIFYGLRLFHKTLTVDVCYYWTWAGVHYYSAFLFTKIVRNNAEEAIFAWIIILIIESIVTLSTQLDIDRSKNKKGYSNTSNIIVRIPNKLYTVFSNRLASCNSLLLPNKRYTVYIVEKLFLIVNPFISYPFVLNSKCIAVEFLIESINFLFGGE